MFCWISLYFRYRIYWSYDSTISIVWYFIVEVDDINCIELNREASHWMRLHFSCILDLYGTVNILCPYSVHPARSSECCVHERTVQYSTSNEERKEASSCLRHDRHYGVPQLEPIQRTLEITHLPLQPFTTDCVTYDSTPEARLRVFFAVEWHFLPTPNMITCSKDEEIESSRDTEFRNNGDK